MEHWILVDLKNDIFLVLGFPNKNFNKDSKEKKVKFKFRLAAKQNVLAGMPEQARPARQQSGLNFQIHKVEAT